MALEQRVFDLLKPLAPCRMLSLGYPDLLLREERTEPKAKDAAGISAWHSWPYPVYDTDAVFKSLGIKAEYFDINASRGCERIVDLNEQVPWSEDKFDVVLDPGTLEHVFNIGQAFWTVRKLCKVGGHIIHVNPVNMVNHGFWNISPTTYLDFYSHHGDKIVHAEMISGPLMARESYELPPVARFTAPPNASAVVMVRRGDGWGKGYPMQHKYRVNPDLKA